MNAKDILTGIIFGDDSGGGGGITVSPLPVTANGTYTAPEGEAYSPIEVNVPNPSTGTLPIDANGTYDVTSYAIAEVNVPSSGGGEITSGVKFIDYDGNVVETWDASSVASKTALPDNPTHTGLVAQGWNWTLANIKSYVAKYPETIVTVGQMYKTASGLTEIDITVTKVTGKTVTCKMSGNKNWGDGTTNSATSHTYTNYGNYTITCDGTTIPAGTSSSGGMFETNSSNNNRYLCTAIRVGERVTSIREYSLRSCYSLTNITIPNSVTSIGDWSFSICYSLANITIPNSVTSIGGDAFYYCYSLANITIPNSVTSIGGEAFRTCYSITNIAIPDSVPSIGDGAFNGCYDLTSITAPDSVTSIGKFAFNNNYSILEYDFSSATSVPTLSSADAFTGINGICKIIVPDALYDSWIVATNWSNYANYIYKASEVAA